MADVYMPGRKGLRSKAKVDLSVGSAFGYTVFYVWEGEGAGRRITHTFHARAEALEAVAAECRRGAEFDRRKAEQLAKL
jgi:hypothetical protein